MKNQVRLFLSAVIIFVLCLSGCAGLRDAYIEAHTTPTPAPLPSSVIGPGAKIEASFSADVNGDEAEETVTICSDGGKVMLYVSGANDVSKMKVNYGSYASAFLTSTRSGSACLFVSVDLGTGDYNTSIFSFDGIKPFYQSGHVGRVSNVSEADIRIEDDVQIFGSWHAYCDYTLKNSYELESVTDYVIVMDDKEPLHVIKELPVKMLVDNIYQKQTLPAGTYIYPESTDCFTYLDFKLEDGSFGTIDVYTSGSNFFIGGLIHDYEYFDNIEYWD